MANIFVTGGTGYLGSCVVNLLTNEQHTILNYPHRLSKLTPGSISADYIIHMAGALRHRSESIYDTNVEGIRNLIKALSKPTPIIFISSRAVYGTQLSSANEASLTTPLDPYGKSKLHAEQLIRQSNCPYLIMRPTSLHGVGINNCGYGFIQRMITGVLQEKKLHVFGGDQLIDPTYVWDLAKYIVRFCNRDHITNDIFNVSGLSCSLNSIVTMLDDTLGKYVDNYQVEYHEQSSTGSFILDSSKLENSSLWFPQTPVSDMILSLVLYKIRQTR